MNVDFLSMSFLTDEEKEQLAFEEQADADFEKYELDLEAEILCRENELHAKRCCKK